jgi:hypothetical protein
LSALSHLLTCEAVRDALREIAGKVWGYCEGSGIRGRTVTLKVKFANFQVITRSRTGQMQVRTRGELEQLGDALLEPLFPVEKGIRLLGISLSSLAAEQAFACLRMSAKSSSSFPSQRIDRPRTSRPVGTLHPLTCSRWSGTIGGSASAAWIFCDGV